MNILHVYFSVFGILAYFIITDKSIAKFFDYSLRLLRFQYQKRKWWLLHNPRNPIIKYMMWRKSMKIAKELMNENNTDD